jgi:hypothetical protein
LIANFGEAVARVDEYGPGWSVMLDSDTPTQVDSSGIQVGPHSASILARSGR